MLKKAKNNWCCHSEQSEESHVSNDFKTLHYVQGDKKITPVVYETLH
jgi:hypothetical protein